MADVTPSSSGSPRVKALKTAPTNPARAHLLVEEGEEWVETSQWCSWSDAVVRYPIDSIMQSGWWFEPLWKIWKSIGMIIPNIWENKKCSKPPTSYEFQVMTFSSLLPCLLHHVFLLTGHLPNKYCILFGICWLGGFIKWGIGKPYWPYSK